MASGWRVAASLNSGNGSAQGRRSIVRGSQQPRPATLTTGAPPDILAATARPPPDPEQGPPPGRQHFQPGLYPIRGPGDQMLGPNLLPDMYPQLPPPSALPRGGHISTDLMPGYHHVTDPLRLGGTGGDALPDIVHSHNVGHAPTPRQNQHRSGGGSSAAAAATRHQRRQQQRSGHGGRGSRGGRSNRRRSRTHSSTSSAGGGRCKEPCVKCLGAVLSLRWVLLLLSMLGVLFVVSGIVMAALHAVGQDFLIYALVFIGLGVVLVAVVVVAWKCTPPGSEPIHALFNIGDTRSGRRERRPRRTHRQRDGQWHGGMMYSEFQYRRPPPSYAASMQAYQAQMADAQSNNNSTSHNHNGEEVSLPGSPPPSYRSRASTIHSGVHITFPPGHDSAPNSRPPTYRSRADSHQRPRLPMEDGDLGAGPSDVSFMGPMNADTVQQIIGTNHRRQHYVWHTRSSSLDLAQSLDVPTQHRRGASLDQSSISVALSNHSQETSRHSAVLSVEPNPGFVSDATMERVAGPGQDGSDRFSSSTETAAAAGDTAPLSSVERGSGGGDSAMVEGGRATVIDLTTADSRGDGQRHEPDHYNTQL